MDTSTAAGTYAAPPWVSRAMTCVAMSAITSSSFDAKEELLWVSDGFGNVRSFQPQLSNGLDWYA
ncbi:hypothetical protein, partial [Streptococcus pneumoniae]|uniref:hypothetical protein n=1 Tax=Streptococcus pneumoniae TaxID=1313 RepID=UPI001E653BCF